MFSGCGATVTSRCVVEFLDTVRSVRDPLHGIAVTQIAMKTGPGRVFDDRKRREGKTGKGALRAMKRRLAAVIFRRMLDDAERETVGPAGLSSPGIARGSVRPVSSL